MNRKRRVDSLYKRVFGCTISGDMSVGSFEKRIVLSDKNNYTELLIIIFFKQNTF